MYSKIAAVGLATSLAMASAQAGERSSKEEAIGVGLGATVGALAGGPVGLIVGAAAGATIGDRFHRDGSEIEGLNGRLRKSQRQVARLEERVTALNDELALVNRELTANDRPGLQALLEEGIGFDLLFHTDADELAGETAGRLRELAATLAGMPDIRLQIDGFADARGDAAYNQALSERRAQHVLQLLTEQGVAEQRIDWTGHGELAAGPQETADGYALQRRVSLTLRLEEAPSLASSPR